MITTEALLSGNIGAPSLKSMRVLLMHALGTRMFHNYPDLGLGYLARSLIRHGVREESIYIIGKDMAKWSEPIFMDFIAREAFDIVGIKVFSGTVNEANRTLDIVKKTLPQALRLAGGPHTSSVLEKVFNEMPNLQFAFRGESDHVLIEFLEAYYAGTPEKYHDIKGLIWRNGDKVQVNELAVVADLDSLDFPCWSLLKPQETMINPFNGVARKVPMAPIMLSRGCNFRCTFCSAVLLNGHGIRYRSTNLVLDELELLARDYGIKEFQIIDSNASASKERFTAFCRGLLARNLRFAWSCPNGIRLESIDEELAMLMHKSGCYSVCVGIESASPRILKQVKKGINLERMKESVTVLRKTGIKVFGFFMIGFPDETREDIEMTLNYARQLDILGGSFSICTPFPGTELYRTLLAAGRISPIDLRNMDGMNFENNLTALSSRELFKIRQKIFMELYFRPRTLLYFLGTLRSPRHFFYQIRNMCRQYFGYLK